MLEVKIGDPQNSIPSEFSGYSNSINNFDMKKKFMNRRQSQFYPRKKQDLNEWIDESKPLHNDWWFMDFSEDSMKELDHSMKLNRPLNFNPKEMDLKKI